MQLVNHLDIRVQLEFNLDIVPKRALAHLDLRTERNFGLIGRFASLLPVNPYGHLHICAIHLRLERNPSLREFQRLVELFGLANADTHIELDRLVAGVRKFHSVHTGRQVVEALLERHVVTASPAINRHHKFFRGIAFVVTGHKVQLPEVRVKVHLQRHLFAFDIHDGILVLVVIGGNQHSVFALGNVHRTGSTHALGGAAIDSDRSSHRHRLDFKRNRLGGRGNPRRKRRPRIGIATSLRKERFRLRTDFNFQLFDIVALGGKASHELVARGLVKFHGDGEACTETAHTALGNVVRGNVLTGFHKAAAFAVLDTLSRREHHLDVVSGHDGEVHLGGERLHRFRTKHVGKVLFLFERKHILTGNRLQNGHMRSKHWRHKERDQHKHFFQISHWTFSLLPH